MGHGLYDDARILAYDSTGNPIGAPILQGQMYTDGPYPICFGKGGVWGHSLYVLANHVLMRFDSPLDSPGSFTTIGTGFSQICYQYMQVGPDGALYVSTSREHRILRIAPNLAPIAICQDVTVEAGPDCVASASVDAGSYDPDGDTVTITQNPAGPYPLGDTLVTLTVEDAYGASDTCTATVTVQDNTPPLIVTLVEPQLVAVGQTVEFFGEALDECDINIEWNFGDGYISEDIFTEHTYGYAGIYTATFTVTDSSGNSSDEESIVVVFDPSGGFVTGGGWIWSPAGAYTADSMLEGKANFGFVSKYKKGATTPTGQTEFVFQAGDLNFHSSSYEWLVVTGSKYARFKGSGTINDEGDYKFMLWAGDDAPDTFRIRIWTEDDSGVETDVYDNGFNQAIGGGSIVIHTK
jgi:PKD repeat protein